jgi:hypothetical protein
MRETELAALTHVRFTFRASEYCWQYSSISMKDLWRLLYRDCRNYAFGHFQRHGRVHGHTVIIIDSPKFISL